MSVESRLDGFPNNLVQMTANKFFLCPWKCSLNRACTLLYSRMSVKTQERHPGVVTGSTLQSLASCASTAKNSGKKAGNHQGGFWKPEGGIFLLHRIFRSSHINLSVQFCSLSLKTDPVERRESPDKVK